MAATETAIAEGARLLRAGELVAVPTETVYGLGARALDPIALRRIFTAKGRPATHPLIAHVLDLDGALAVASNVEAARAIAETLWPGPITFVLPRRADVPDELSGGLATVAVRAPAHPVARALIAALGEPIAAPSANRYQAISPTRAEHVLALGDAVSLILDGGPCARGIESTVVDLTATPTLLRHGPISVETLRGFFPSLAIPSLTVEHDAQRASPGMDARHYAPTTPTRMLDRSQVRPDDGIVSRGATFAARTIVLPDDPDGYAAGLYAALHALDGRVRTIWIEPLPDDAAWDAVRDRITRATAT